MLFKNFHNVLGLRLIVTGKAACRWSEYSENPNPNFYSGAETYVDSVSYLFGSENGEVIALSAGVHTYNFEYLLPAAIPYSLEGLLGFVRYNTEATLDIPFEKDFKTEKAFIVRRHDDLNLVTSPNYRQPCEVEEIKTICGLCWDSDFIMTLRLPRTGFGLGETIPIQVQMVNQSGNRIRLTKFKIKKIEQFNSTSPQRSTKRISDVFVKTSRGVYAYQTEKYVKYLEIPRVLPTSNDRFCNVFQIKYYIHFKVYFDNSNEKPFIDIPITIGNVAITDRAPPPAQIVESEIQIFSPTAPESPPTPAPAYDLRE